MTDHEFLSDVYRWAFVTVALFAIVLVLSGCSRPPKPNLWRDLADQGDI